MTRAERIIKFIESKIIIPDGKRELVGEPFKLVWFQKKFIRDVYDNPSTTRTAILSVGRKNGKTALIAALVLAHIVGPEMRVNGEVVSGARSRDQAGLVYDMAVKMLIASPALKGLARWTESGKKIVGIKYGTKYKAMSAEAGTAHGLSPVLIILDEAGQIRGPKDSFVEAIETSQGAYDDAITIVISTQAASDSDWLSVRIDDALASCDPKIVCHVYQAKKDADILDETAWADANPALGIFRSQIEFAGEAHKAARMPSAEAGFRNLYLNQRVERFDPFISPGVWKAAGAEIDTGVFLRSPVYGGLDLSETSDLTSLVLVAEENGLTHVLPFFWKPAATLSDHAIRDRAPYDDWLRDGFLFAVPGKSITYDYVAERIANLTSGMNVQAINFDRWNFTHMKPHIDRLDLQIEFTPFGQGYASMAPAVSATEVLLLNEKIRHGNHPVLTMCAANATVCRDPAGNRKLDKSKRNRRIDGIVAMVMAVAAASVKQGESTGLDSWIKAMA